MTLHSVTPVDPDLPNAEIDLLSTTDQPEGGGGTWSLLKLLKSCPVTCKAIESIPVDMLEKTEDELLRKPDDLQRRLKISFWNEFRRAQRQKCDMTLTNIVFGVCTKSYWHRSVNTDPAVLAWIITPPTSDILVWQDLIELGYRKLRRVLKLPLVEKRYWKDKSGEVHVEKRTNVALVKEIRAIVENLQNRLHGAVVQRQQIEARSLSVNVNAGPAEAPKSATDEMDDIKRLLGRIEKVAGSLPEIDAGVILDGEIAEDPVE